MIVFRKTTETKTKYFSKEIITSRKLLLFGIIPLFVSVTKETTRCESNSGKLGRIVEK